MQYYLTFYRSRMNLTTENIEIEIKQFIIKNFSNVNQNSLDEPQAPFMGEIVDSLGIIKIINFIESEFDILVEDEDILPQNFQSISAIVNLVQTKIEIR
jgi:acyl carrier protein